LHRAAAGGSRGRARRCEGRSPRGAHGDRPVTVLALDARPPARADEGGRRWGSEPGRMADGVAVRGTLLGLPAGVVVAATARVEAQAGDDHVHVAAVGVNGDPLAGTGVAP